MARLITIVVVNDSGCTVPGVPVKEYGGQTEYTDRNGRVQLVFEGSQTTIYVNGFTAYDGAVSRLNSVEVFTKTGGRP